MDPLPQMDAGQNLAGNPQIHGHTQINENGLNLDVRVSQQEVRANGPSRVLVNTISV